LDVQSYDDIICTGTPANRSLPEKGGVYTRGWIIDTRAKIKISNFYFCRPIYNFI